MAYIPSQGSVVAFQSQPSSLLVSASVIGLTPVNVTNLSISPSVIAYQLAGSVMQVTGGGGGTQYTENNASTPSVVGNAILYKKDETNSVLSAVSPQHPLPVQGSITTLQGTNPWVISNPSVTAFQGGAWSTSVTGGYINVIGSVALGVGNTSVTQAGAWNVNVNSILGTYQERNTVTPSAIGIPILYKIDTTNSVLTAVSPTNPLPVQGSVTALQGTNPWIINQPSPSIIMYQAAGSVLQVTGGGGGTQYTENNASTPSVVGNAILYKKDETNSVLSAVSPQHPLPVQGSVTALQSGAWSTSVTSGYLNVIGSVATVPPSGTWITSVMNTTPSSLLVGASIIGLTPVNVGVPFTIADAASPNGIQFQGATTQGTATVIPQLFNGASYDRMRNITYRENSVATASVFGVPFLYKQDETNSVLSAISPQRPLPVQGSVTLLQGTNPLFVNTASASVLAVISSVGTAGGILPVNVPTPSYLSIQPAGSVINANISGSVAAYLPKVSFGANNTWTQSDSVISMGWVRNDTMSSITAADSRYSGGAVGPIGENIVANSPITKWIQGIGSVFNGTSIQVLAAQGTSVFTYVTGIQMINPSANNAYVTFTQGVGAAGGSTIGWGIVPANGGTNMVFPNPLRTLDNRGVSASVNAVASVYVMMQGFISKT